MGKKSSPKPPSPEQTAQAQAQANKEAIQESAKINRYNIENPFGTTKWVADTSSPQYQKYQNEMKDYEKRLALYNAGGSTKAPTLDDLLKSGDVVNRGSQVNKKYYDKAGNKIDNIDQYILNVGAAKGTKPVMPTAPEAIYNQKLIQELSPDQQRMLDLQEQLGITLGGKANTLASKLFGTDFNYEGISGVPTDYSGSRKAAEDRVYESLTRNMDRDFGRVEETLRQRLANQGLPTTGAAFERELANYYNSRNQASQSAADQAYRYGATEEANLYNRALGERNRQIAERLQLRTQPMNELAAILQGSPAIGSAPQANQPQYQVQSPDVAGAINTQYQGQLQNAQQKASKKGDTLGTAAGIGLSFINPAAGYAGANTVNSLGGLY